MPKSPTTKILNKYSLGVAPGTAGPVDKVPVPVKAGVAVVWFVVDAVSPGDVAGCSVSAFSAAGAEEEAACFLAECFLGDMRKDLRTVWQVWEIRFMNQEARIKKQEQEAGNQQLPT